MWEEKDPINSLGVRLKEMDLATEETLATIEKEVMALIDEAVTFAEESPLPEPADTLEHVFYTAENEEA